MRDPETPLCVPGLQFTAVWTRLWAITAVWICLWAPNGVSFHRGLSPSWYTVSLNCVHIILSSLSLCISYNGWPLFFFLCSCWCSAPWRWQGINEKSSLRDLERRTHNLLGLHATRRMKEEEWYDMNLWEGGCINSLWEWQTRQTWQMLSLHRDKRIPCMHCMSTVHLSCLTSFTFPFIEPTNQHGAQTADLSSACEPYRTPRSLPSRYDGQICFALVQHESSSSMDACPAGTAWQRWPALLW